MKTNMFLYVMFYTFPQNNSTSWQINSLAIILPFLAKQAIQAYTAKWVTIPGIFYPSQVPKHHKGFTKTCLIQVWYPGEAVASGFLPEYLDHHTSWTTYFLYLKDHKQEPSLCTTITSLYWIVSSYIMQVSTLQYKCKRVHWWQRHTNAAGTKKEKKKRHKETQWKYNITRIYKCSAPSKSKLNKISTDEDMVNSISKIPFAIFIPSFYVNSV